WACTCAAASRTTSGTSRAPRRCRRSSRSSSWCACRASSAATWPPARKRARSARSACSTTPSRKPWPPTASHPTPRDASRATCARWRDGRDRPPEPGLRLRRVAAGRAVHRRAGGALSTPHGCTAALTRTRRPAERQPPRDTPRRHSMTKAIRLYETGGPEGLQLEEIDVGEPRPGQARVRHTYIAVNFIDIYFRTGLYPLALPNGLGSDAVGVVEAVGPGVTDIRVGDRVGYLIGPQGSYAQARVMPAEVLIPLPEGVSD